MIEANPTIGEVLASMLKWQKARTDASVLTALFRNTSYFLLDLDGARNDHGMHLYPGIGPNGNLEIFAISVCDDRPGTGGIESCITRCEIIPVDSNNSANEIIDDKEAIGRIDCWQENYPEWIRMSVEDKCIFNAFYIPGIDFPDDSTSQLFFPALYPEMLGGWGADIIVCIDMQYVAFRDTVRPVPPFKPYGKLSEGSFYLLNICMELNGESWNSMTSLTV